MSKLFSALTSTEQQEISAKFNLPTDTTDVMVDYLNRPYAQNNGKIMYRINTQTLIDGGFHTSARVNS